MNERSMERWGFVRLLSFAVAVVPVWGQSYVMGTAVGGGIPITPAVATSSSFGTSVSRVAPDLFGNIYFAADNCVYRMDSVGVVTRVAGSLSPGGAQGDNGPALTAQFNGLRSIAVDYYGNLYLADTQNNRIRKIDATKGIVTAIAGTGQWGFSGDGGQATKATIFAPYGITLDRDGNVYFTDLGNNRIRKIIVATGVIVTVAGNGGSGSSGDGGAALNAQISPNGIAADAAGNLYFAENSSGRIRKVTASTGMISTVAGTGMQGFSGDGYVASNAQLCEPLDVSVDSAGNLYIPDSCNNRVRRVAAVDGTITTIAGSGELGEGGDGGPAVQAQLNWPSGAAVDNNGRLFITDGSRIRMVDPTTGIVTTVAGGTSVNFAGDGGPASNAQISEPRFIAVDSNRNLYVCEQQNQRIRKVSAATGVISTIAGNGVPGYSGDGGQAVASELNEPLGIAVDPAGNIFVVDNGRVRRISAAGTITTIAGGGCCALGDGGPALGARLTAPNGLALDGAGNIYVSDPYDNRVRKISANTGYITTVAGNGVVGFSGDGGPATSASLYLPVAIALDNAGNLYIADTGNHSLRRVAAGTGMITTIDRNSNILGLAMDGNGNLLISTPFMIYRRTLATGAMTVIGGNGYGGYAGDGGPAPTAEVYNASGMAVDSAGYVYVADTFNDVVRVLTPTSSPKLSAFNYHAGNFSPLQHGATFSLGVWNAGSSLSTGTITVTETVPPGLDLVSMSGDGWTCPALGNTCTRSDALAAFGTAPNITVTVNVNAKAASQVTNLMSVTGGGSIGASAFDTARIITTATQMKFITQPVGGSPGSTLPTVILQIQDANGQVVNDFRGSVNVSSSPSNTGEIEFAINGVVTFDKLRFTSPGTYTITASGVLLPWAISNPFVITSDPGNIVVSGAADIPAGGLRGVTITANGSVNRSVVTDEIGLFYLVLPKGGSYTLSASRVGYTFNAPVQLSNVTTNQSLIFNATAATGLHFIPVTPCRLVDTRVSSFPAGFGPPALAAGATRTFAIPSNTACGIPSNAAAFSLNVTAVTKGYLGILSIGPAGQAMPNVSTLNSYSTVSTAVANAAIVPAGTNGAIQVYATDATELILDVNGYFAPPVTTGLEFYPVTPCRVVDTRVGSFQAGFGPPTLGAGVARTIDVTGNGACAIPSTAAAYSLNLTAIPRSTLGALIVWPAGQSRPNVSTLNVYSAGTTVANAAIVPAGSSGAISLYATDATDLVMDINGYFAPASASGQRFYPLTPCRVADTRGAGFTAPFGTPVMAAGTRRSFPVTSGECSIPSGAGAYSLNFTAVPRAAQLGMFATWPAGVAQPNASTMNSYNGSVVANAAIVPSGTGGAVNVYVTDAADVLFDVNGYFGKQ